MDSNILKIPHILLPREGADYEKWAIVAVDQFTSEPHYWQQLDSLVGDHSALRVVFPEIYLNGGVDKDSALDRINSTMREYLDEGFFRRINNFVLVERTTNDGMMRIGLMVAMSLDAYDFRPEKKADIRATEATVAERLPIRVDIRRGATIELPHAMMLVDDRDRDVIGAVWERRMQYPLLYDFDLNMDGGHIRGYEVTDSEQVLADIMCVADGAAFPFAVGDGNHSLAAAKLLYEEQKAAGTATEAGGYALVELVNLHCSGLSFQPIHRVFFGADMSLVTRLQTAFVGNGRMSAVYNGIRYDIPCSDTPATAYSQMAAFVNEVLGENKGIQVDYIHGEEHLLSVACAMGGVAVIMPTIAKDSLFPYVEANGILPKKAFSMGEAEDKRYYLEARRIK